MMGSADIRPSLQPEQKEKTPKTLRDFRFEHSFTVHVMCPCRRRRRDSSALEAVAGVTVVVVIVAVAHGPEAVPYHGASNYIYCLLLPNPMPGSWDAWRHRPWGFGSVNVPPGYARWHDPRGFGRFNVLLGYARGHGPQRFGGVNVPAGRCHGRGPRGFHTPYLPGPARRQGPGRVTHASVSRAGGLVRAHRQSSASDSFSQSPGLEAVPGPRGHRAGALRCASVSCASVSCASVSPDSRPCGRRILAVWPLESGRVASGLSPYGVSSFYTPRLGTTGPG